MMRDNLCPACRSDDERLHKTLALILSRLDALQASVNALTAAIAPQKLQKSKDVPLPALNPLGVDPLARVWPGMDENGRSCSDEHPVQCIHEGLSDDARAELADLRRRVAACSIGDRPPSLPVSVLRRLFELEALERLARETKR